MGIRVFHGVEKVFPQRGKFQADFPHHGKLVPDFSTAWKLFFHGVENRSGGRRGPACHAGRRGTKDRRGLVEKDPLWFIDL